MTTTIETTPRRPRRGVDPSLPDSTLDPYCTHPCVVEPQVVDLAARRVAKVERARAVSLHPSLRWVAGRMFYAAHRKDDDGTAACGANGDLILAPPGVPLCVACYPLAERAT